MRFTLFLLAALLLPCLLAAAPFSPWDAWRQGYTLFEKGQQQKDKGSYKKALQYFEEAKDNYLQVQKARPDWNQKIIMGRIKDCEKAIETVQQLLGESGKPTAPVVSASMEKNPSSGGSSSVSSISGGDYPQLGGAGAALNENDQAELLRLRNESDRYKKRLLETLVELDDLRRQLARTKNSADEISNLLRDQRVMQEKYVLLEKRYKTLEKQILEPDTRLAELRNQLVESRLNYDLLAKRLELAELRLKSQSGDISQAEQFKRAAETQLKKKTEEITRLEREKQDIQKIQATMIEDREDLRRQMAKLSSDLSSYESRLQSREKELADVRKRLEEAIRTGGNSTALNHELLEENRRLRDSSHSIQGQLAAMQNQNSSLQRQQAELQAELQQARDNIRVQEKNRAVLADELENLRKTAERDRNSSELTATELRNLRERNQQLSSDVKAWSERSGKLEQRLANLTSQNYKSLAAADGEKRKISEELAQLSNKYTTLHGRANQLDAEKGDLEERLKQEHAALLKARSETLAANENVSEANKKLTVLQNLRKQLQELQGNFMALQKENASHREKAEQATVLQGDLDAANEKLKLQEHYRKQIAELQKENQSLTDQNRRLQLVVGDQGEIELMRQRVAELQKENSTLRKEELPALQAKVREFDSLRRNMALLEQKAKVQDEQLKELESLRQQLNELNVLRQQLRDKNNSLELMEKRLANSEGENKRQKVEIANFLKKNQELQNASNSAAAPKEWEAIQQKSAEQLQQIAYLQATQDKLSQQLAGERQKNQDLEQQLKDKSSALSESESLKKQLEALRSEKDVLLARNRNLQEFQTKLQALEKIQESFSALQAENQTLNTQSKEFQMVREKMLTLQRSLELLQEENKRIQEQNRQLLSLKEQAQKSRDLENELNVTRQQIAEAVKKQEKAEKQLAADRLSLEKDQMELAGLRKQAENALADLEKNRQNSSQQNQKEQAIQQQLRQELRTAQDLARDHSVTIDELKLRNKQLESMLKTQKETSNIPQLTAKLQETQRQLLLQIGLQKKTADELETAQQQLNILQQENRDLAAQKLPVRLGNVPSPVLDDLPDLSISAGEEMRNTVIDLIAGGKKAEAEDSYDLAVWNYRAALEKDGANIEAAGRLGLLYLKRDEFKKAEPLLAQARSVDPDDSTFTVAHARALAGLGKYGNSLALIEPMLAKNPNNLDLLLLAGSSYTGAGQFESAKVLLQRAMEKYPMAAAPFREYARLLLTSSRGQEKEAARFYQTARTLGAAPDLELEPRLTKLLAEQREILDFMKSAATEAEKNEDWNSASWYYRQMLNSDKDSVELPAKLAFAYYRSDQYPAAAEVLAMHAPSPQSGLVAALLQLSQQEYAGAAQKVREARKMNRNAPINLSGQWSHLKKELNRVLDQTMNPNAKEAVTELRGAYL